MTATLIVLLLALAHLPPGWLIWRALSIRDQETAAGVRVQDAKPGLVVAAPNTARAGTAPPDLLDELFAALGLGLAVTGWLALVLAEVGLFSPWLLAALWLPLLLAAAWRLRRRRERAGAEGTTPARPSPALALALAAWLALAGWLYFRPHEYILGGADAGVYVNLGAQVARSGRLLIDDPLLADLPAALVPALLRPLPPPEATPYYLFPGFYVPGEPAGLIVPQFYPLYPAWLAVGQALGGVGVALRLAGLWAVLGGAALFLLARRLGGPRAAALLLAGLTLCGLQVWFARYPTTETLAQFQLWTGVWAAGIWWEAPARRRTWGLLAALAWGELLLTRIDMIFLLALPALLLALAWWRGRLTRAMAWFFVPLALLSVHTLLHAWWQSWPYFLNTYGAGLDLLRRNPGALAGGLLLPLLLAGWIVWRRRPGRRRVDGSPGRRRLARSRRLLPPMAGAGVLLLAAYAWFVRPHLGDAPPAWLSWYAGDQIPVLDRENLVRLGWYLSPAGVWLGVIGIALRVARPPRRHRLAWALTLGAGGFFTLFYIWRLQNNPTQVYAMRRYVPAVMPFLLLLGAWLLARLGEASARPGIALTALLSIAWLAGLAEGARGLITQVDALGLVGQVAALAEGLPPNAVLLFADAGPDAAPVSTGDFLGTPLRFLYDRPSFRLRDASGLSADQRRELTETVRRWQASGRVVYWVGDPDAAEAPGLTLVPARQVAIQALVLEGSRDHRPETVIERSWNLTLSEIATP